MIVFHETNVFECVRLRLGDTFSRTFSISSNVVSPSPFGQLGSGIMRYELHFMRTAVFGAETR